MTTNKIPAVNLTTEQKILLAEKEAKEQLKHILDLDGACNEIWSLQKKILKEKYQIDWKSPAEEHPGKMYD